MSTRRVQRGRGDDIKGLATVYERNTFQERSMRSSRTPKEEERSKTGAAPREDPNAKIKIAHFGEYGAPTIYTESEDSRRGGRGLRVKR